MFTELQDLLDHKKEFCRLRFTCKCNLINDQVKGCFKVVSGLFFYKMTHCLLAEGEEATLLCVQCKEGFSNAWDLMVHVQASHMLNIYQLGGGGGIGAGHAASGAPAAPPQASSNGGAHDLGGRLSPNNQHDHEEDNQQIAVSSVKHQSNVTFAWGIWTNYTIQASMG
ncbi:hypothetical protein AAG570_012028 [Ranatra chinensis]|uniref:C2H2-type domain-containing protein n=1 Tax=Ranatra chinensis TaxID=642074 RepID=A0ABD0YHT8_9HEMI